MSKRSGGRKLTGWKRRQVQAQGWLCPLCGKKLRDGRPWNVDHVRPRAQGGSDSKRNLQVVHAECNQAKADSWDGESGYGKRYWRNHRSRAPLRRDAEE